MEILGDPAMEPQTTKKPSGLRPPTKLPELSALAPNTAATATATAITNATIAMGVGLGEIGDSALNVQPQPVGQSKLVKPGSLLAKSTVGSKHTAEPETAKDKRRKRLMASTAAGTMRGAPAPRETLAERAGRTNRSSVPPPSVRAPITGVSLVGSTRNPSTASSRSSRSTTSAGSRNTSNTSYASSSIGGNRPSTAYGHSRGLSHSTRGPPMKRSATALGNNDDPRVDKRTGTIPKYSSSTANSRFGVSFSGAASFSGLANGMESLTIRKRGTPRKNIVEDLSIFAPPRKPSGREVSLSTQSGGVRIATHENSATRSPGSGSSSPNSPSSKLSSKQRSMGPPPAVRSRTGTISSATSLTLSRDGDMGPPVCPKTPSFIPLLKKPELGQSVRSASPDRLSPSPSKKSKRGSPGKQLPLYLSKDSNVTTFTAWDVDGRLEKMESMYEKMQSTIESTQLKDQGLEEAVNHYKIRLVELESKNASLETRGAHLDSRISILDSQLLSQQAELDSARQRISSISAQADDDVRAARRKLDDALHEHQREVKMLKKEMDEELERMKRTYQQSSGTEMERMQQQHRQEVEELHRQSRQLLLEEERRRMQEVSEIQQRVQVQEQNLDAAVGTRDQQITQLTRELQTTQEALENEKTLRSSVQNALTASSASVISLEAKVLSLQDRIQFLESGSKAQSDRFALMEQQLHDALEATKESKQKLIHEETLRRILFNQVQELKGNIRVMCRVRPPMRDEQCVTIKYPDLDTESKALELLGPEEKSSLGTITRKTNAFSFDRVFGPSNQNEDVFAEISQLVQSALDGYNVCIFAYGQTGAGKTHTMSSADGMIPRTAKMIYAQAKELEDKGWNYTMEGSFVEVYNEEIHDLLGSPRDLDKTKHEIRHDDRKKQTTVTNLKTVELDSADAVNGILNRADANRSVAATKSNERSSRSHSVFILKLVGRNSTTGDVSEGTLNLVDLAGSERLKQSGAEGDRMKETQNINKSLSCLGDVIGALGQGKEGGHIPYRNSKLTYLLQYSLGGNSKTLMFVMVSPLEAHLKETLTSLKFATKVHNTHIGTARKMKG